MSFKFWCENGTNSLTQLNAKKGFTLLTSSITSTCRRKSTCCEQKLHPWSHGFFLLLQQQSVTQDISHDLTCVWHCAKLCCVHRRVQKVVLCAKKVLHPLSHGFFSLLQQQKLNDNCMALCQLVPCAKDVCKKYCRVQKRKTCAKMNYYLYLTRAAVYKQAAHLHLNGYVVHGIFNLKKLSARFFQ